MKASEFARLEKNTSSSSYGKEGSDNNDSYELEKKKIRRIFPESFVAKGKVQDGRNENSSMNGRNLVCERKEVVVVIDESSNDTWLSTRPRKH